VSSGAADIIGRALWEDDHKAYRESVDTFLARRVVPEYAGWRAERQIPRELFRQAAQDGFLGIAIPESYGGTGVDDPRFGIVVAEQAMQAEATALALALAFSNDVVVPALLRDGNETQRGNLLGRLATAEIIGTVLVGDVAITGEEGGALVALDGPASYVVQGIDAELLVIVGHDGSPERRPTAALANSSKDGITVTASDPGLGLDAAGLADIVFTAGPGQRLGDHLAAERVIADLDLALAVTAVAGARDALRLVTEYVLDRKAFGQPIASFQNTRQALAKASADLAAGRAFLEASIGERLAGGLSPARAAALRLHCTALYGAVVDAAVQLHGGYGYMMEYPIAHAYTDARFWRLTGGTDQAAGERVADELFS
jgi:alkylation response protein AidB-like acyl-CoA dehydrogenase